MSLPPFILEIYDKDRSILAQLNITDVSHQLTFKNIIGAIQHYLPNSTVSAFKYLDEDNDYITVRTDRETADMIKSYVLTNFDRGKNLFSRALVISPSDDTQQISSPLLTDLHVQVPSCGSPVSRTSAEVSASPRNSGGRIAQASGTGPGSGRTSGTNDSPHSSISLQNIMNGPLSADPNRPPLSASQVYYDPARDSLGSGNGGSVYKAIYKPANLAIALKLIRLDTTSADVQKQIISELSILHRCRSPFIISFVGAFFAGDEIHIATEYMDGGSLDLYKPIPEQVVGRIAVMVVHGLQYMWTMGIMHRDVKPSNMLVNSHGLVKLCDFGVSRQLISSTAITYCGTYAYMSPERLNQLKGYRIQSDLWSLGVSLYEMGTGSLPYPEESLNHPVKLFNLIDAGKVSQLPRSEYGLSFCLFVNQCMSKPQEKRPHPRTLIEHPFIAQYNDGNTDIVANIVRLRQSVMASHASNFMS